jgi:hypothetical protein
MAWCLITDMEKFAFYSNFEDTRFINALFAMLHTLSAPVITTVDTNLSLQTLPRYIYTGQL